MPSLVSCLQNISHEILIVDNKSDDGSVRFLKENYPKVILRENIKRKGYGANHNFNLHKARGKYVLFMNADVILMPGALSILCDFMEKNRDVGISSANVLNRDGTLQYLNKQYPTILDLLLRRFAPFFLRFSDKRLHYYEMREIAYDCSIDVPFISGCFMFCRTSFIKVAEGFDERFFLYFEDVDLCRKVQRFAKTVSCPDAKVIHRWERLSHKKVKYLFVFAKSAIRYFNKWGYSLY